MGASFYAEYPIAGTIGQDLDNYMSEIVALRDETKTYRDQALEAPAVVQDPSEIIALRDETVAARNDTFTARDQAQAAADLASGSAAAAAAAEAARVAAEAASGAATNAKVDAEAAKAAAEVAATNIEAAVDNAVKFAESPRGTPFTIDGNQHYSAFHYMEEAKDIAKHSLAVPSRKTGNGTDGVFAVTAGDMFREVEINNTLALTLSVDPNIYTAPPLEAGVDDMKGWVRCLYTGTAMVTIQGAGTASINPSHLGVSVLSAGSDNGFGTAPVTGNVTLKAGQNRRALIFCFSQYLASTTGRSDTIALAGHTVTRVNDATHNSANAPSVSVHVADIGSSTSDQSVALTFTRAATQALYAYAIVVITIGNSDGHEADTYFVATDTANPNSITRTITPAGNNSQVYFAAAQVGYAGAPATLNAGSIISQGNTGSPTAHGLLKDLVWVVGTEQVATPSLKSYTATFAASDGCTSGVIAFKPKSGTAAALFAPGGRNTVSERYRSFYLHFPADRSGVYVEGL